MGKRQLLLFLAIAITTLSLALLISACSKSSSSPTGPGGAGGVVTVTGKVIGINNQPVASVPVLITGLPSVNTDANGSFTIPNVTTPYSIAVVDGVGNRALVYRGLTRSDPTLVWLRTTPGTSHIASVSGSLIPWTAIAPGTKTNARIAFVSTDAAGSTSANLTSGTYTIGANWYGSTTTTGSLYALVWDYDVNNLPTTFSKYGKRANVTLLDGTTNANQNDTLGVAQTGQISGTVTVAAGYTLINRGLTAVFESKG
ncbi:MAG: carboxypeptidase regulatory-like domain-containing protein, partial [Bacteroidota bacterium]